MFALSHGAEHPRTILVMAPSLFLTVTIEREAGATGDEIHIHPGGQGFWVSRLLAQLGCSPVLCGPLGGEAGTALKSLVRGWGVALSPVDIGAATPCLVYDRRSGRRELLARDRPVALKRHEADDLYGAVLSGALEAGRCVVVGAHPGDVLPGDVFERLGADFRRLGVAVAADLHGWQLDAYLRYGRLELLKVSDEDLLADGRIQNLGETEVASALRRLARHDARCIVASRAERGALMATDGNLFRAVPPLLDVVDHIGSGDSMTAALIAALIDGANPGDALRMGCAAGAANVTRHGLGSASAELIRRLAATVEVQRIEAA